MWVRILGTCRLDIVACFQNRRHCDKATKLNIACALQFSVHNLWQGCTIHITLTAAFIFLLIHEGNRATEWQPGVEPATTWQIHYYDESVQFIDDILLLPL